MENEIGGVFHCNDGSESYIMKTCPYNVYPLEPHFYIAKLGYAGVYLFLLFLLQNIDCGYSLEPPHRGNRLTEAVLTFTHNLCFEQKQQIYQNFQLKMLNF